MKKLIIKLFAFIWRLRIFNPVMIFIELDYSKLTKRILKLNKDYETEKSYFLSRNIEKVKFNLDLTKPTQRTIFFACKYENKILNVFKKNLKSNDIFFDIGAHIGYYSLILSNYLKNGMIYSFEPNSLNYKLLEENVKSNGLKNVITENLAVSDFNGIKNLHNNPFN